MRHFRRGSGGFGSAGGGPLVRCGLRDGVGVGARPLESSVEVVPLWQWGCRAPVPLCPAHKNPGGVGPVS